MDLSQIINELGEERENYFRAVSPPIMQTSNFAFKKLDDMVNALADESCAYLYSRGINPTIDILRKKLAALDAAEDCLVFNSGAAAIFAGVLANVKAGDHIVSVKAPYTWAARMFDVILPRFNVTTTYIDGTQVENWIAATKENTSFFYLESPNSWDFALQPIGEVAGFARSKGIITMIDNSYCTPVYQQPIPMGIDLCMQTATKYIGGHSDVLGGVLTGSASMMKRIFDSEYLNIGSGIQPFNAWLLIRGLRTLPTRIDRITRSTAEVVQFMKDHPMVDSFLFPFDENFPQHKLARHQMKGACGLFTFSLKKKGRDAIVRFCDNLKHVLMAVSWGGHESLVIPKCAGMQPADFDEKNEQHHYIRMYVGLEEPAYIIEDLQQALASV
jgi:cystathionine beta-lyase/cystathionine gamma-synthase